MTRSRLLLFGLLAALVVVASAHAQTLKSGILTLVVPFAAGEPSDVAGRILAQGLTDVLGQNVVVENPVGAGGTVGSLRVSRSAPDGGQFVLGNNGTHSWSQSLYKNPPYDAMSTSKPQIEGNHVKGIATTGLKRSPALPGIATAKEQGLDFDVLTWQGLFLAKNTPAPIVNQLNLVLARALDLPTVKERLAQLGKEVPAPERRSAEYFKQFVSGEIARWSGPIKASGVTVE